MHTTGHIVFMFSAVLALFTAEAQEAAPEPISAPLNPAFVEWQSAHTSGVPSEASSATRGGYVPPPFDSSYLAASYAKSAKARGVEALPSRFNLCDSNWVTSVKNQGSYGTCWAHATMASLETWVLRTEGQTLDLSENNLANLHGFDWDGFLEGGNGEMAAAYLLRWGGPVLEADDHYPSKGTSVELPPMRHVQNVKWIPRRTSFTDRAASAYSLRARACGCTI